ncbi:HAD-IA family hydrolase [Flagellatimonas centrodinii]|uniref:HAD family hydrolase n=1 Tax=Flagellatimonas centrodinii TaxID=2806210 RepID=UPI001FF00291|nr:HAD-IA family hydrolase [Flagellatimonas centrodinii]ULQ46458.1 HAD-IA family hydrolase [Flagellatimonas centrodinii]
MSAWLFDLDGTLVDTAPDLAAAANHLRRLDGLSPLPVDHYRPAASGGARGLIKAGLGLADDHPRFPALRDQFLAHYRAHLADQSRLFEGLEPVLRSMEQRHIPWGVVTNKPAWLTVPLMTALDLAERAAVCVSADEAPAPKPAPDALLLACARAKLLPGECHYVGDDRRDIEAGRAAGMRTVAVNWGYTGNNGAPASWGADHLVDHPTDLLALIR